MRRFYSAIAIFIFFFALLSLVDIAEAQTWLTDSASHSTSANGDIVVTIQYRHHNQPSADPFGITGPGSIESTSVSHFVRTYTITIRPESNAEGTLKLTYNDPTIYEIQIDTRPPELTITTAATGIQTEAFDITITASEAINGFAAADITIDPSAAATVGALTRSTDPNTPNTWTATITPANIDQTTVTIAIPKDAVTDGGGNENAAVSREIQIDTRPPKPILEMLNTPQNDIPHNAEFRIAISASESVQDLRGTGGILLTDLEISPSNAVAAPLVDPSSHNRLVVIFRPADNTEATVTITVAAGIWTDAAGHQSIAGSTTVEVDTRRPQISFQPASLLRPQNAAFDLGINFTEDVSGFAVTDLQITGPATLGADWNPTENGPRRYDVRLTPAPDAYGIVTVTVPPNVATDAATNGNRRSAGWRVFFDLVPPTPVVSIPQGPHKDPFDVTITFSEAVGDFTTSDITIALTGDATVGALTRSTDPNTPNRWTATLTPALNTQKTLTISIPANAVQDAAQNQNTAAASATVQIDTLPPTLTIAPLTGTQTTPFDITITASETINGFEAADITIAPAAATVTTLTANGNGWTATITPDSNREETLTISIAAGTVTDAVGNTNAVAVSQTVRIDTLAPELTFVDVPEEPQSEAFDITITALEPFTGFGEEDFTFTPANFVTATFQGTGNTRTITVTPIPDRDVWDTAITIAIPAEAIQDSEGNTNKIAVSADFRIDTSWIADPNLRQLVREILGLSESDTFSQEDMLNIDRLEGPRLQIESLQGLETAEYLTELTLDSNQISDLTPLVALTELTTLKLQDNNIEDITPLEDLTFLTHLDLAANGVADLTPLGYLLQLTTLNLRENYISEVTPLAALIALTDLDLTTNQIEDVAPLAALSQLKTLRISDNPLTDVTQLTGLAETIETDADIQPVVPDAALNDAIRAALGIPAEQALTRTALQRLITLHAPQRAITELTGLENAVNLTTLELEGNAVTELTALAGLRELTALNLSANALRDVTPLAGLTALETLDLSGNTVSDIGALAALTALKTLNLNKNQIADLTPLANLPAIETLKLRGCNITDVAVISTLTGLIAVDISENDLRDITNLKALTELTILNISDNALRSIEVVAEMRYLRGLDISGNRVADLSALAALSDLMILDAGNNAISTLAPLAALEELRILSLSGNNLSTLKVLAALRKLKVLDVRDNTLTDIAALSELENLERLDIRINNISNVAPLRGLPSLTLLRLAGNPVLDTSPLFSLTRRSPPVDIDITVERYAPWDVNTDGRVNAIDTQRITVALGQSNGNIRDPRTDVNADGTVDAADLALVRENYDSEDGLAAPAVNARRLVDTQLLPNYPNPFNPETWIPYQLQADSDVEIFIHDARGTLVQHIHIGHRKAGDYTQRTRAAHWNGRNAAGEPVASGVYFYTFKAGDFTATRKMIIRK